MSNYLELSTTVVIDNDEQKEWLLKELSVEDSEEYSDEELTAHRERYQYGDICDWPGFLWSFQEEQDDRHLWIHSDESADIEVVASLIQEFIKKFRPHDNHGFECSYSASRPFEGAFGGSAVFVTAEEIKWMHTNEWLGEQYEEASNHGGSSGERKEHHSQESN